MTRRRFAVAVAVVLIALTWAVWWWQAQALDQRVRAELSARANRVASAYANDVNAKLDFVNAVMAFVASFDAARGIGPAVKLVRENHLYAGMDGNILLADRNGRATFIGPSGEGRIYIGDRPHVRAAFRDRRGRLIIGAPIVPRVKGGIGIPFARAVRTPAGALVGVASTAIPARPLLHAKQARARETVFVADFRHVQRVKQGNGP